MKEKEQDIEKILLSHASLDDLIRTKIEKEFKEAVEGSKKQIEKIEITDISKVPKNLIFSKKSVFRVFNRNTKTETKINGIQAEAMLGVQHSVREKIIKGELSSFATDDAYIKFEKAISDEQI